MEAAVLDAPVDLDNFDIKDGPMLVDIELLTKEEVYELAMTKGVVVWRCDTVVKKYHTAIDEADIIARNLEPDEITTKKMNLLLYGGASCLWEGLKGALTATPGQALTYFDNTNAAIGVGDSSTAPTATQTDLQASTNKLRAPMSATFPTHADGVIVGAATITYQAAFTTGQANFAWNEVGVFNSVSAGTGRMLNRVAPAGGYGTKSSGVWTISVALTLA